MASLEELLGLVNIVVGLFVLVFTLAYFTSKTEEHSWGIRCKMALVLAGLITANLVGGFVVLGGALTSFGDAPSNYIIPAAVVMLAKLTAIVASVIGTIKIINYRRKNVKKYTHTNRD